MGCCVLGWTNLCCCGTLEREDVSSASCKAVIYDVDQRKVADFHNQVWLSYGHMQNRIPVGGSSYSRRQSEHCRGWFDDFG